MINMRKKKVYKLINFFKVNFSKQVSYHEYDHDQTWMARNREGDEKEKWVKTWKGKKPIPKVSMSSFL